jgi:hypothetical protein
MKSVFAKRSSGILASFKARIYKRRVLCVVFLDLLYGELTNIFARRMRMDGSCEKYA